MFCGDESVIITTLIMKKYLSSIYSEVFIPAKAGIKSIPWNNPLAIFTQVYRHFMTDSLYRNSIYLILSTAVQAFLGFFFWIIVARLYDPENVGIATTLISVTTLISGFSIFGFNVGLVRFLPTSKKRNEIISSCFFITAFATIILSFIFVIGIEFFSPKLLFLRNSALYMMLFIIFTATLSVNTVVESIFIAFRSAKFTLIKNIILSITKVILPVFLIFFSAFGIYASVGIANFIAFLLSIGILISRFRYQHKFSLDIPDIKKLTSYSFRNYIAGILGGLPQTVLPVMIINKIGAKESAYFYIAMMIANLIYTIPLATTQSLFAEISNFEEGLKTHIIKAIKIISLILFITIFLFLILGKYILYSFGKSYSLEALPLLQLLIISSFFISINNITGTYLKVKNKVNELIIIAILNSLVILFLSAYFIKMGLLGIGLAWFIGQIIVVLIHIYFILRENNSLRMKILKIFFKKFDFILWK